MRLPLEDTTYTPFENKDNVLLKLSPNVKLAKNQIEDFFISSQSYEAESKAWLDEFIGKECNLSKLFEVINA